MLVFFIIIAILLISLIVYLSGIKIQIHNIEVERKNKIKIKEIKISIYFMLFNKIKLIKIEIDKEKIKKIDVNKLTNKFKEKNINADRKIIKKGLKELKLKLESINIRAKLGLNDTVFLAYLVAVIDIVLSIVFAKLSKGNMECYKYVIKPCQTEEFYFKISINCIINIKIANIINIIIKNGSEKNERTSNRSINGNCHEQYTRYGRCKHYYRSTN